MAERGGNESKSEPKRSVALRRELKGLALLYLAFAVICAAFAATCSGPVVR